MILLNNKNRPPFKQQKISLTSYQNACLFIFLTSITVLFLNHFVYRYHGFNYINESALTLFNEAILFKLATKLFEPFKRLENLINDFVKLFGCFVLLMIATTAIQFTPFHLIDNFLFKHEKLPLLSLIDWTKTNTKVFDIFAWIYNSLNPALYLLPLVFTLLRQTTKINSFCHYMIFTGIIGFGFYFFFPSCGPVHLYDKTHFLASQVNNYQKYYEIHHNLIPGQVDGGLIACPSFHVIWAWACARFFISNRILFPISLTWFLMISASTILLGWHYSIDVLFAFLIICSYEIHSTWALKRSPYWLSNWQNKSFN